MTDRPYDPEDLDSVYKHWGRRIDLEALLRSLEPPEDDEDEQ